jgi:hypothetical protein
MLGAKAIVARWETAHTTSAQRQFAGQDDRTVSYKGETASIDETVFAGSPSCFYLKSKDRRGRRENEKRERFLVDTTLHMKEEAPSVAQQPFGS